LLEFNELTIKIFGGYGQNIWSLVWGSFVYDVQLLDSDDRNFSRWSPTSQEMVRPFKSNEERYQRRGASS